MHDHLENKWFCIANPVAGRGKALRARKRIEKALRAAGLPFEWHTTQAPGHAISLVSQAISVGYRRFIAIGGDGTGHEVINGMMSQSDLPASELYFSLLPIGTGNDWQRCYSLPRRLNIWVKRLRHGQARWQDIGRIHYWHNGQLQMRYFFNVVGLAYGGYVGKVAASRRWTSFNKAMYLWLVLRCLFEYTLPEAQITFGKNQVQGKVYTIHVGICPWSGGGIRMVPQAQPNNGLLALTWVGAVSRWEVLRAIPLLYNGKIGTHPAVQTTQVQSVHIEPMNQSLIDVEADGEYLGKAPAYIDIIPRALQLWI